MKNKIYFLTVWEADMYKIKVWPSGEGFLAMSSDVRNVGDQVSQMLHEPLS